MNPRKKGEPIMKKTALALLAAVAVTFLAVPALRAGGANDFQAIQKAVKQNPAYEEGKEVKWFNVLVTDGKSGKEKVKITLPLTLIETFLKCSGDKHLRLKESGCDIDFQALFTELKKIGPMALIEINDSDEIVKVWLE
jgi:hypothetical protein